MLTWIVLLLTGSSLVLAFAPFHVYVLAAICPAIYLYYCYNATTIKQACSRGLGFGLGFYGAGVYWVYISVHHFGGASILLASFILALLIVFLALFTASLAGILAYLFKKHSTTKVALSGFPALWVIFEWLREIPFNGFPWLYLGYTQIETPLHGIAPWFGVYGVSLAVCIIAGSLMLITISSSVKTKLSCTLLIIALLFAGWLLSLPTWTKPASNAMKVSLVQGNIPQTLKWQPQQLLDTLKTYFTLTKTHLDSTLIIWPEAAIPVFPQQASDYISRLDQLITEHHSHLIFGAPLLNEQHQYFNGLLLIGQNHGQYVKRHLVPFGEYTPLSFVFNHLMRHLKIPMSNFTPGNKQQPLLNVDNILISPFICYEIAFPQQVITTSRQSNLLITLSDDSWFGHSIALAQHQQIAQMRALESQRYVLLATNTGITAFINPHGKIVAQAPLNQATVLTHDIIPMHGETPLMFWDYYPLIVLLVLMIICVLYNYII